MFVVANSLRCALRKTIHRTIPRFTSTSTSLARDVQRTWNDLPVRVQPEINDKDDGGQFVFDEEPLALSPEKGFGYYPITLGQQLGEGKLEIVRKLGWAGHSSVWLARTLGNAYPAKYVAVKVLTVNATAGVVRGFLCEVDSLRTIKTANPDHPGYQHCLNLYEVLTDKSRHGPHICLVTNILGENMHRLGRLQPNKRVFPLAVAKRIVKQTLLALDYLHRECGFVHTDVKPDNVLVCVDYEDEAITRVLQETPSATYEPRFEPTLSPDPIITVKTQPLPNLGLREDASNLKVCLIDFGHALPAKEPLAGLAQIGLLRAPEVILGHEWSTPIDIWSMGCLAFEYLTGAPMILLSESPSISMENLHLQRILEHIGPFPPSFLERCQRRADFFDEQGSLRVHNLIPQSMESCLRAYKVMGEKDISSAAAFIRKCLTIDPHARPTALELLDDEWLKNA
ncbi:kinase-like domain-containing protein [Suillus clintonianus]|uniref:kinase-like domain-containing protein n=1 Tax=Suillus clintonianus TaxID=1904413 RepID=UPI001B862F73|nr:kinase-like domain-containing protein [Suillus clintonianus]KAG2146239.1 kinase-like domain-containing protein [Suillus clintonianus]